MGWDPFTLRAPAGVDLPTNALTFGPDIDQPARIIGDVADKRVLDLGCGAGANAVALAKAGARAIGIEEAPDQIDAARAAAEAAEVRVELHHGPLYELTFLRADTIDVVLSVWALDLVTDVDRVLRQVHRVMRTGGLFVISVPHPALGVFDLQGPVPTLVGRRAGGVVATSAGPVWIRTMSQWFTSLSRSGFELDAILEPEPAAGVSRSAHWVSVMDHVPGTLILRARKPGS